MWDGREPGASDQALTDGVGDGLRPVAEPQAGRDLVDHALHGALGVAQPGCDLAWFESLTDESVRELDQTEKLSLLEQRRYRWECGCSLRT